MAVKARINYLHPLIGNSNKFSLDGRKIGMLKVHGVVEKRKNALKYHCTCDCGNDVFMWYSSITRSRYPSCGCQTLPHCKRRKNGTFAKTEPGYRKPLGPKLKEYFAKTKYGMRSDKVQMKAQISRCIGRILARKTMFNPHKGSRLETARNLVKKYNTTTMRKLVKEYGLKGAVALLYSKYENI